MLTEVEKSAFALSTIRPMAEYTLPYLTQVVGVVDEHTGEHCGTGLFCMIEGREAIVTAGHVIERATASGRYESLSFTRGSGEPPTIVAGTIVTSANDDLAVYLPSRPFPLGPAKSFWPVDRVDRDRGRLRSDYLFLQGFPGRFSRATRLVGNALVSEALAYGAMSRLEQNKVESGTGDQSEEDALPDGFLEPHQFALNFSVDAATFLDSGEPGTELTSRFVEDWSHVFCDEGQSVLGTTPLGQRVKGAYGLSGSPVWRIGAAGRRMSEWTPDWSRLVGIVTHWNAEYQILIATFASSIFDVIPTD